MCWLSHLECYKKSASFVLIIITAIKRNMVLNFKSIWCLQKKHIFVRMPIDKIMHLESYLSATSF